MMIYRRLLRVSRAMSAAACVTLLAFTGAATACAQQPGSTDDSSAVALGSRDGGNEFVKDDFVFGSQRLYSANGEYMSVVRWGLERKKTLSGTTYTPYIELDNYRKKRKEYRPYGTSTDVAFVVNWTAPTNNSRDCGQSKHMGPDLYTITCSQPGFANGSGPHGQFTMDVTISVNSDPDMTVSDHQVRDLDALPTH